MANQQSQKHDWVVRPGTATDLQQVEPLWYALYEHEREFGLALEIQPGAFKEWEAAMNMSLGRFSCLFVAEQRGQVIGFVGGWLKMLPAYHGGTPIGFLSEMYVNEGFRSQGIGHILLETGAQFFHKQGISRVEGQVLGNNVRARTAYQKWGWAEEYIKIIWHPSAG
jgi:GNAT superfamily N-acetyltransferase